MRKRNKKEDGMKVISVLEVREREGLNCTAKRRRKKDEERGEEEKSS